MITITIEEAQARLTELIAKLAPGEEVTITRDHETIARIIAERPRRRPRSPGNCRGKLVITADDEEHLRDWEELMP